ncbi:hypothetical protein HRbin36_02081 [bacterium HR36]|nr:hypothetical protein HRbin36_02081 [bacterium HR36]
MESWLNTFALALGIFIAETCVVTLSTVRTILISRHQRLLAPLLGVVEITLWLLAITQVMRNISSPIYFAAFVAGFGMGNYLGVCVEDRMALGYAVVQVITRKDPIILVRAFRESGFGITRLDGHGVMGPVHLLFSVVPRAKLPQVNRLIETHDPEAFYTVDELRRIRRGFVPQAMVFPFWPARKSSPTCSATVLPSEQPAEVLKKIS